MPNTKKVNHSKSLRTCKLDEQWMLLQIFTTTAKGSIFTKLTKSSHGYIIVQACIKKNHNNQYEAEILASAAAPMQGAKDSTLYFSTRLGQGSASTFTIFSASP